MCFLPSRNAKGMGAGALVAILEPQAKDDRAGEDPSSWMMLEVLHQCWYVNFCSCFIREKRKGAGDMAQQAGGDTAFAEDLLSSLVPNTHPGRFTAACNSRRISCLWSFQIPAIPRIYPTHKELKISLKEKQNPLGSFIV